MVMESRISSILMDIFLRPSGVICFTLNLGKKSELLQNFFEPMKYITDMGKDHADRDRRPGKQTIFRANTDHRKTFESNGEFTLFICVIYHLPSLFLDNFCYSHLFKHLELPLFFFCFMFHYNLRYVIFTFFNLSVIIGYFTYKKKPFFFLNEFFHFSFSLITLDFCFFNYSTYA